MIDTRKKLGLGTSHAKIILLGEHSVVYGHPAIALPLKTLKTTVQASFRNDDQLILESRYYTGPLAQVPPFMNGIKRLVEYILMQNNSTQGLTLKVESELPIERGMGSSASVAIAIVRALAQLLNFSLEHTKLLSLANIAEKETHKNPSGLDAATSASETPIWLIRDQEITSIPIAMDAYLVICDSGIKGQTSEAILAVKEALQNDHEKTAAHLDALGDLAHKAKIALATNDVTGLGHLLDQAQDHLKALGVSNAKLDELIALAKENGALGAKLTGGGRGGCFICLVSDQAEAKHLAQILLDKGAISAWIEPLSQEKGTDYANC